MEFDLFYPYIFLELLSLFGILCRKWEYFESFLYIIPFIMHALFVCKCGTRISMVVFFPACILQKRRYAHLKATVFNAQAYQHFYKRPTDDEGIVQSPQWSKNTKVWTERWRSKIHSAFERGAHSDIKTQNIFSICRGKILTIFKENLGRVTPCPSTWHKYQNVIEKFWKVNPFYGTLNKRMISVL